MFGLMLKKFLVVFLNMINYTLIHKESGLSASTVLKRFGSFRVGYTSTSDIGFCLAINLIMPIGVKIYALRDSGHGFLCLELRPRAKTVVTNNTDFKTRRELNFLKERHCLN